MNGPIEVLMHEHRVIERVLDALTAFTGALSAGTPGERERLASFVEFLRGFADRCHHGKEEDILFRAMIDRGLPRETGPIGIMLEEHDMGRALVGRLADIADASGPLDPAEQVAVRSAAASFVQLLRDHIAKEDNVLYPLAQRVLPPEAMDAMGERFEEFERETMGAGTHERLHALADFLTEGVAR